MAIRKSFQELDAAELAARQREFTIRQEVDWVERAFNTTSSQVARVSSWIARLEDEAAPVRERALAAQQQRDALPPPRSSAAHDVRDYERQRERLDDEIRDLWLGAAQFSGTGMAAEMSRWFKHRGLELIERELAKAKDELKKHRRDLVVAERELAAAREKMNAWLASRQTTASVRRKTAHRHAPSAAEARHLGRERAKKS